MGEDRAVGGRAARRHAVEQRGLEPAAVLVAPLEIHVRGPAEILPVVEHRRVARAGVKPDIHNVGVLAQVAAATLRTDRELSDELFGRHRPPAAAAVLANLIGRAAHAVSRQDDLAAVLAVKGGDGHAPDALAADAPVGTVAHHIRDAVLAPVGDPFHLVDTLERLVAEIGDGDEPLIGGAENYRLLAAPAMRIGVGDLELAKQAL